MREKGEPGGKKGLVSVQFKSSSTFLHSCSCFFFFPATINLYCDLIRPDFFEIQKTFFFFAHLYSRVKARETVKGWRILFSKHIDSIQEKEKCFTPSQKKKNIHDMICMRMSKCLSNKNALLSRSEYYLVGRYYSTRSFFSCFRAYPLSYYVELLRAIKANKMKPSCSYNAPLSLWRCKK